MVSGLGFNTLGGRARNGSRTMQRALRTFAWAASIAAVVVLGNAAASWALSPDDAIELTKQGTSDDVIIAKICADAEAWDLTSDDIKYLQDKGVSDDVVSALMDPKAAADRYGYQLGQGDQDEQPDTDQAPEAELPTPDTTPYVFTPGYYYGPLARAYCYDPFFYPYMYSAGFSFSIGWPAFYASYYWPYAYGYYGYPYFACAQSSYYYGGGYCGSGYNSYRVYYQGGGHPYGGGTLTWHDWSSSGGGRHMLNTGGAVEQRSRSGQGYAMRGPGSQTVRQRTPDMSGLMNREMRSGVVNRGSWIRGGDGSLGSRVVRGGNGAWSRGMGGGAERGRQMMSVGDGRAWGRSRVIYGGERGGERNAGPARGYGYGGQASRGYGAPASRGYGAPVYRGGSGRGFGAPARQGSPQIYRGGSGGGGRELSGISRGYSMGRGIGRGYGGMAPGQGFGRGDAMQMGMAGEHGGRGR